MIDIEHLKPGEYVLGTRTGTGPHAFGRMWVWSRTGATGETRAGQWILELHRSALKDSGLAEEHWGELLGRLGLHPISFAPKFLELILSPNPVAIIADTSALHSGAALQLCRLRRGRATHFAVPDQVYMEMHSQRELESLADSASRQVRTNLSMYMGVRNLERLRGEGHVVHFARPPEAMVRYLGSEAGTHAGDEQRKNAPATRAPNYVRDRLVIEAARECRRSAPALPLYVLTTDVKLALQTELEQFGTGLCKVPSLPVSLRYGSPWISPHTLAIQHLPVDELLDELAWILGSVYLQEHGAAEGRDWALPAGNEAARHLLRKEKLVPTAFKVSRASATQPAGVSDVPKTPPTAQALVGAILKLASAGPTKPAGLDEAGPYLTAFGWAELQEDRYAATPAGIRAADAWRALTPEDVIGWCDWMDSAAAAAGKIPVLRNALDAISARPLGSAREEDVKKKLNISVETARKLVGFGSMFGIIVRINGKLWAPSSTVEPEGEVLEAIKRVAARSGGSAAPAERVFTDLLPRTPLPIHVFRRAIYGLVENQHIERDRGTMSRPPKTGDNEVRVRVLNPDGKGGAVPHDVNLGHGTFLLPGTTMQDLVLRGATS